MNRRISIARIKQAARRVVLKVHPEKVILFGSHAYGKPTMDSDVDLLLVIKQGSKKARQAALLKASLALDPRPFPVDLLVKSRAQMESRIAQGDYFLQDIEEHGRILYQR